MTRGCTRGHQLLPTDKDTETHQGYALDEERPETQKALHDEPGNDALDFRDTGASSVLRQRPH